MNRYRSLAMLLSGATYINDSPSSMEEYMNNRNIEVLRCDSIVFHQYDADRYKNTRTI